MSVVSLEKPSSYLVPAEFDPASVHPASIITLDEEAQLSERARSGTLDLSENPASIPLLTRLVSDGYGELILRVREGGSLRPVTKEEYAKAYRIFQKYVPRLEEIPRPLRASRIEMMREELRTINPNMVGTFIPRTLHDLIFIRKAIEEDIEKALKFPFEDPEHPTKKEISDLRRLWFLSNNSWCTVPYYPDASDPLAEQSVDGKMKALRVTVPFNVEKNFEHIVEKGYRLNLAACEIFTKKGLTQEHLRLGEIQELVEDHIDFLQKFHTDSRFQELCNEDRAGVSSRFLLSAKKTAIEPMGVGCEEDARIIRNAASLECRESSIGKLIAYRGGDLSSDYPVIMRMRIPYCISFGSGIFPGVVNDPGACAFRYMKKRPDSYALVLDPTKESSQVFLMPAYTALESLFGNGESWHYRFKVSKAVAGRPHGVDKGGLGIGKELSFPWNLFIKSDPWSAFKSPLTGEQLIEKFEDLKRRNLVILKSGPSEE